MEPIDYLRFFNSIERKSGKKLRISDIIRTKEKFFAEKKQKDDEDVENLNQLILKEMEKDALVEDVTFERKELDEIIITEFLGYDRIDELARVLKPRTKRRYIFLDSLFQNPEYQTLGKHSWRIGFDGNKGDVTVPGEAIRNIIAVRMSPFLWLVNSEYAEIEGGDYTGKRETLIEEFAAQSFVGPNGRKFHFVCSDLSRELSSTISRDARGSGVSIPYNDGWYRFNTPIRGFNTLTLSYSNALRPTRAYDTKLCGVLVQNSNPMEISFDQTETFLFGRILASEYFRFTITGFTTGDPVADAALIQSVAEYEGPAHFDYAYEKYIIGFNFDLSGMTPKDEPIYICLHFNKYYRHCVTLEFVVKDD
jgi:hypothetical protein